MSLCCSSHTFGTCFHSQKLVPTLDSLLKQKCTIYKHKFVTIFKNVLYLYIYIFFLFRLALIKASNFSEWAQVQVILPSSMCSLLTPHTSETMMTSSMCTFALTTDGHFRSDKTKYIKVYLKWVGLETQALCPGTP